MIRRPAQHPGNVSKSQVFRLTHRVAYHECTVGNHVYYGRYLDLLEEARGEFFRACGLTFLELQDHGVIFPVIECHLRYKAAARYDDNLVIEVWLTELKRVRINFAYRVVGPQGELVLEASSHHVCTTLEDKPARLPDGLVVALSPYLIAAAAR
jgi:acyl-CoA thioester hydrolase